jgi:predicted HicB family RNase H-like nuclease
MKPNSRKVLQKPEKKITTIRLDVRLLEKLKAEANEQGRSLNNLIERKLVAA